MKREKIMSCLCAAGLAFLLGLGSTACMVTGLTLPVDLLLLAGGCAIGAVIAVVCFNLRFSGLFLSGIAAAYGLLLAVNDQFWDQLWAMCYSAMDYYNRGYGIPIPEWINGQVTDNQLLPVTLIAGLIMTATVWTVMRRKRAYLAVTAALLPLASCLVVTDTVPDVFPIFLLLLGLVLLMMTQSVRRRDEVQGCRLTAILLIPVTAALLSLIWLVPQSEYSAPDKISSLQDALDWLIQKMPVVDTTSQGELVISLGGNAKDNVDLSRLGWRLEQNTPVMELSTDYSGTLYLRGRDYDIYTGLGWKATDDRVEQGYGLSQIWSKEDHNASIRVLGRRGQYYLPYYSTVDFPLTGGMLENPDYKTTYTFQFSTLRSDWKMLYLQCESGLNAVPKEPTPDSRYLELPDETRLRAEEILKQLAYSGSNDHSKAESIGNYVRSSASYDLHTNRMPGSEKDFAIWFLQDSDTGYCVHFATAATVLLRAAGIPARYVEGYMVETQGGETTIVRERTAHAWVEYYLDHVGWVILEATPSSNDIPDTTTGETTPPETNPPVTTPPATTPSTTVPQATKPQSTNPQATTPQPGQTTSPTATPGIPIIGLPGDSSGSGSTALLVIPQWFLDLLLAVFWASITGMLIIGQWLLRRYLKLKRLRRGKANTQALARYREADRMARLSKLPIPDALHELAEKAKFSQHTLTKEELATFNAFLLECRQSLHEKPWYYRLICRFVFAAY